MLVDVSEIFKPLLIFLKFPLKTISKKILFICVNSKPERSKSPSVRKPTLGLALECRFL